MRTTGQGRPGEPIGRGEPGEPQVREDQESHKSERTRKATGQGEPGEPQVREDQESHRSGRIRVHLYHLDMTEPCIYELRTVMVIFRGPV